jgi:cyclopropane-fatty-acyl-phospholipid synthase
MTNKLDIIAKKSLKSIGIEINGSNPQDIKVHNDKFYGRVLTGGSLALGESYMDRWWDCKELDEFFYRVLKFRLDKRVMKYLSFKNKLRLAAKITKSKILNLQNVKNSKVVGKKHYDTGNFLFSKMLDKRMQYSCGYWLKAKNLDEAQEAKLDLICRKIKLKPGMRVLDIGCGFGGFAKFASEKYKAKVVGVTISQEQAKYAREVCKGLDVDIRLQDYRNINEKFDRIVSIGMFEHVGSKNFRKFFEVSNRLLENDGLFLLHTIGSLNPKGGTDPWLEKYIFPGGMLPSEIQIIESSSGLFVNKDLHNFAKDYSKTLEAWHNNFKKNWEEIKKSGNYDERFKRMWEYYLMSCKGAFDSGNIQLWQFVFTKPGCNVEYQSIR